MIVGSANTKIPSSVTRIGDYAFSGSSGLTSIEIPSGVTGIGWGAFEGCSGLTNIEIPESVNYIGNFAFYGCDNLTTIKGYKGSYAETYANKNGYKFVDVENTEEDEASETPTDKDKLYNFMIYYSYVYSEINNKSFSAVLHSF